MQFRVNSPAPRTENYSFDVNGNRTMPGYQTGTNNRLLSDGTYNYSYDNEGNTLTKTRISDGQVTENTWDYRNRLTRIVLKDAQGNILKEQRNTYDVDNRRIGVWEDTDGDGIGTQRWTVYDGANPYADFNGSGNLTSRYLYGPAIDQLFGKLANGEFKWYLGDIVGSVRQIVKTDGTVLDNITYDSFGQILVETHAANGDRFKYTSREWDALFGQYYYRARYYGPDIGRFTSLDPKSFAAGDPNLYRYVSNGPVDSIDPTGLDALRPWWERARRPAQQGGPARPGWNEHGGPAAEPARADEPLSTSPFALLVSGIVWYLTDPSAPKPWVTEGSSSATSILSWLIQESEMGSRLPRIRIWAPTAANPGAMTANVARGCARWMSIASRVALPVSFVWFLVDLSIVSADVNARGAADNPNWVFIDGMTASGRIVRAMP